VTNIFRKILALPTQKMTKIMKKPTFCTSIYSLSMIAKLHSIKLKCKSMIEKLMVAAHLHSKIDLNSLPKKRKLN